MMTRKSVNAHPGRPTAALFLVHVDLIGKWVGSLSGYGWDVVLVGVGVGDDLHDGRE